MSLPVEIPYPMELAGYFVLWTLMFYWSHRCAHHFPFLWKFHSAHHAVEYKGELEFSWWNPIGWFNDWESTLDQWITEIIPTLVFVYVFPEAWPILVFYYIDGFILSEGIWDHNPRVDVPGLAAGRYHLKHHADPDVNFDLYFRFWDKLFGTQHRAA